MELPLHQHHTNLSDTSLSHSDDFEDFGGGGGDGSSSNGHCLTLGYEEIEAIQTCGFWVEGVSMAILGVVALATNLISVYVFTRKEMRNSFNSLIVVLTVIDCVFCVLLVADYSFARAFEMHTVIYTLLYPHFLYPFTNIMLSASIFMTVVLGLERYIAVCYPLVHRDLAYTYTVSTRVCVYTVPVVLISILVNVPKFLETKIVTETSVVSVAEDDNDEMGGYVNITTYTIDVTDLRNNPIYIKYYMNIARTLLHGIVPFLALIFFNVKIYMRFLHTRGRYSRNNNNSSQAKDLQLAMILVCVVCMFFITNLPRLLLNFYELFNVDEMIRCGNDFFPPVWFLCMTSVNHLLLVLNAFMNFVVYCCFNQGFKRVMLKMVGKKVESSRHGSPMAGSQVVPPRITITTIPAQQHNDNNGHCLHQQQQQQQQQLQEQPVSEAEKQELLQLMQKRVVEDCDEGIVEDKPEVAADAGAAEAAVSSSAESASGVLTTEL